GVFAGVPFALKDFLPSKKGWKRSYGGVKCLVTTDEESSLFCEVMEKAGAIAVGKVNAPSYGFRGVTDNKMYGPTSTPFNAEYNSGGSSGGSAAAVADGLVPIAEGGDAGGSIRIPAACCNLVGFAAGTGAIPMVNRPDAYCATDPFCLCGAVVKTVDDAIALYKLMSVHNSKDPYCNAGLRNPGELDRRIHDSEKLKIAFTYDFNIFEVEEEIKKAVKNAAGFFKTGGHTVKNVNFDFKHSSEEFSELWCKGITVDCAIELNHKKAKGNDLLKEHSDDFPEEFIYYKELCDRMTIEDLYQFNLARTDVLDNFEKVFEKFDLIISPVMCCLPVKNETGVITKGPEAINGKPVNTLIGFCETFITNFAGYPAISVPAGLAKENLPVGMQIIGKRFDEATVLKAAKIYEQLHPWKDNYKIALERM
nr:amidase [Clostridiales bacterium]